MRTETTTRTLYAFSELSDEAKERAINEHREFTASDMPWQSENVDTLKAFEAIFPVKVKGWEYGDRNYISWIFMEGETIKELQGWRLVSYLWNNYKTRLFKGRYYSTAGTYDEAGKYHYKFRHSKIKLDNCCVLTGYCMDDDILKDVYAYMNRPDARTFHDLMNDCLHNWVFACRDEHEYQLSDEAIIETIEANEYEFTEQGALA